MDNSTLLFDIPASCSREIIARFDGGDLSSDAGLLLVAQADERIGLTAAMASALSEQRQKGKIRFDLLTLLRERIYAIAAGYEDCNDLDTLRDDPTLRVACRSDLDDDSTLASQPTLSRFENAVPWRDLVRLGTLLAQHVVAQLPADTKHVYFDLDATVDPCHGQQELSLFDGHAGTQCYLPLLGFITDETGKQRLTGALLRSAVGRSTKGNMTFLRMGVRILRERFPSLKITVRGDCGFGYGRLINWCEKMHVDYLLGMHPYKPLLARASWAQMEAAVWARFRPLCYRVFDEWEHQAYSWDQPCRIIAKAEAQGAIIDTRFVVTSDKESAPDTVYQNYSQRGDIENRIKEFKLDLQCGRTSCHRFLANQFRLLLHHAAAILMQLLQQALEGTELARSQVSTLRLRLLKVAARVKVSCRKVWFHLPTAFPLQSIWHTLLARLRAGPACAQ
jgi:hypothetical protein